VTKPKSQLLAPKKLVPKMVPGAVFIVSEGVLTFPEERAGTVTKNYDGRRVIIVQGATRNRAAAVPTVLVVPCTASRSHAPLGTLEVPEPLQAGFTKPFIVVLATHVQPVLKGDLKKHVGDVPAAVLGRLQTAILQNLSLAPDRDVALPGR
jgi:mRNA-degrading endonuclease toxin of MazEF toxin-antitoxin module